MKDMVFLHIAGLLESSLPFEYDTMRAFAENLSFVAGRLASIQCWLLACSTDAVS